MIHGGKIALLGILKSDSKVDWSKIIFNGLIIKGIYGREMHETWYKMSAMLQSGLNISNIIKCRVMSLSVKLFAFQPLYSGLWLDRRLSMEMNTFLPSAHVPST